MSSSFAITESSSYTIVHARHKAAKVAADLKRLQRHYGKPDDPLIEKYEQELIALLRAGYLGTVKYGFYRNGRFIEPTLHYDAKDLYGAASADDDPGQVRPWADVSGADFHSYLTYSASWDKLSWAERDAFKKTLPFYRKGADEPGVDGYLQPDLTYSAGGRALGRSSLRSVL
jgi:hypothetical protein